jgi:hypothetical protein
MRIRITLIGFLASILAFCFIGQANAEILGKPKPLTVVGITIGQTARISVRHWVNPDLPPPTDPFTVVMEYHDTAGRLLTDRSGRVFQRTVTINPGRGAFLDLNGNEFGSGRLTIIPCIKVLSLPAGSRAVPTFEVYSNDTKKSQHLSPGVIRGFNPQPDPPGDFGIVGVTAGQTIRINAVHVEDPNSELPPGPCRVELTFHNADGRPYTDRAGRPITKIVDLQPGQIADSLDFNLSDFITVPGIRITVVPCIKIHSVTEGSLVGASVEVFNNDTLKTMAHANWIQ